MPLYHYLRLRWSEGFATASDLPPGAIGAQLETYGTRCLTETRGEFGVFASDAFPSLGIVWTLVGEIHLHSMGRRALFQHSIAARPPLPTDAPERILARAFERLYGRDEEGRREANIAVLYGVLSRTTYEQTSEDVRELFLSADEALAATGPGGGCLAAEVTGGVLRRHPDLQEDAQASPEIQAVILAGPRHRARPPAPALSLPTPAPAQVREGADSLDLGELEETDPGSSGALAEASTPDQEAAILTPDETPLVSDHDVAPVVTASPPAAEQQPSPRPRDPTAPQTQPVRHVKSTSSATGRKVMSALVLSSVAAAFAVAVLWPPGRTPNPTVQDTPRVVSETTEPQAPAPPTACFRDEDGDGYAVSAGPSAAGQACAGSEAFKAGEDCADADPSVYPGASEDCDGRDSNCDGAPSIEASSPGYRSEDTCLRERFAAASMKISTEKEGGSVGVNIQILPRDACDSVKVGHGRSSVAFGVALTPKDGKIRCTLSSKTSGAKGGRSCGAPPFDRSAIADDSGVLRVGAQCCRKWGQGEQRCEEIATSGSTTVSFAVDGL